MPGEAVAVLWHQSGKDDLGRPIVRHHLDLYVQSDSWVARKALGLLGPAAPRMAKDGAAQLLTFFSAVARHLHDHPEKTNRLLAD